MSATTAKTISTALLGALLALAAGAMSGTAFAQTRTVAEIANYTGADRQAMLEAGARKEGAVMLYATATQIQPLLDAFKAKYPYIRLDVPKGDAANVARKVLEEYQAGVYNADAFELSSYGLIPPRDAKILQPFNSPELSAYDANTIEPGRHWVSVRESYIGIGFNTDKIPLAEGPKTYKDLLDPKWKGRMAISGSVSTAANWIGLLVIAEGADFVRKLGRQNIRVYQMTSRAVANLMISGEVELSPTTYNSHVEASNAQGAKLAWFAPGPIPVTDTAMALTVKAPHPHAAMLLIDFFLSKEAHVLYQKLGYESSRKDMVGKMAGAQKVYLANRPRYLEEFEDWVTLYQKEFLNGAAVKRD
jgi:iron(III) transport system substrate-binding protein